MPNTSRRASPAWFAPLYDTVMRPLERRLLGRLRAELLADLHGDVLEIGAGTGANFALFAAAQRDGEPLRVSASEPDAAMRERACRRAEAVGLEARFVEAPAEALPFEDASFDVVVVTLVLCSVADVAKSLAEVHRVLRPGGELRYLEHVRAEGLAGRLQDSLRPAWACIGAGCQLNRRTASLIDQAGFERLAEQTCAVPWPVSRILSGRARRGPIAG